jgi:hypothetical protein
VTATIFLNIQYPLSPATVALPAGFKLGSNGVYILNNAMLGLLGLAEPVHVLAQLSN